MVSDRLMSSSMSDWHDTLAAARAAWRAARVPYLQTEVFRFGNPVVDDWEGRVNSWPLDEGLIDYVDANAYGGPSEENPLSTLNVIATPKFRIGATEVDATTITADTIRSLHEADGIEANVASGYHAVEFLLWGQDLNGTGPGAGPSSSIRAASRTRVRQPCRAWSWVTFCSSTAVSSCRARWGFSSDKAPILAPKVSIRSIKSSF